MEVSNDVLVNLALAVLVGVMGMVWYRFHAVGEVAAGAAGAAGTSQQGSSMPVETAAGTEAWPRSSGKGGGKRGAKAPAESGSAGAAAAAVEKSRSSTRYTGTVKRYSERNGMGFVICEQTKEKHNVDVRIYRDEYEAAGLKVGASVSFHTALGGKPNCPRGHPWATSVVKIADVAEDAEEAMSVPRRTPEERADKRAARAAAATGQSEDSGIRTRNRVQSDDKSGGVLKADAPEWVPPAVAAAAAPVAAGIAAGATGNEGAGAYRLKSAAPAFVPAQEVSDAAAAAAASAALGAASVRGRLQATAPMFVPSAGAGFAFGGAAPGTCCGSGLDAKAPEFVPAGACGF